MFPTAQGTPAEGGPGARPWEPETVTIQILNTRVTESVVTHPNQSLNLRLHTESSRRKPPKLHRSRAAVRLFLFFLFFLSYKVPFIRPNLKNTNAKP